MYWCMADKIYPIFSVFEPPARDPISSLYKNSPLFSIMVFINWSNDSSQMAVRLVEKSSQMLW